MRKNLKLFILMIMVTILIGRSGRGEHSKERDVYNVYLGCDSPEDTVTYILMDKFASLMEEKSNGRIDAKKFSNAKLGGDLELLEGLQYGQVTFVVQTTAPQVNFIPELAIFDLGMSFPTIDVARNILDGPLLEKLKVYHEKQGIKLYGYADQGFRQMTSNKKVNKFSDLKGIKIRTMSNPNHIDLWKAVGSNPTPMNFGELYIGLQQGVVDAQENPLETTIAAKLQEQQDYLITTNHLLHALSLVGSLKRINELPKDLQKIIDEAAEEAIIYARQKADERTNGRLQIMVDSGTEIIPFNENLYNDMKKTVKKTNEKIKSKLDPELVNLFEKEVNTYVK